jgi:ribosomal-protein-alanine N-acetyltransferase
LASTDLHLRPYRRTDLDAIFRLDEVCFDQRFRFSRAVMRRFADAPNACTTVAEESGQLVGFCMLHVNHTRAESSGYIVTLDVEPNYRRQGLATKLMHAVEVQALNAGCSVMTLHVFQENEGAIRFYERDGYLLDGEAKDFYGRGVDALVYRKPLLAEENEPVVRFA